MERTNNTYPVEQRGRGLSILADRWKKRVGAVEVGLMHRADGTSGSQPAPPRPLLASKAIVLLGRIFKFFGRVMSPLGSANITAAPGHNDHPESRTGRMESPAESDADTK